MAGPKNPHKPEIALRLERSRLGSVDRVRCQRFGGERRGAGVGDCVGCCEAAVPVADPVGIAGPDGDGDPGLDDAGE